MCLTKSRSFTEEQRLTKLSMTRNYLLTNQTEGDDMASRFPSKTGSVNREAENQKSGEEGQPRSDQSATTKTMITASSLNFYYGKSQALFDVSMKIPVQRVTAFIGPSGCGKSTFLRTLNRMNDIIPGTRV